MAMKKTHERAVSLLDELKSIFTGSPKKNARTAKPSGVAPKGKTKKKFPKKAGAKKTKAKKTSKR